MNLFYTLILLAGASMTLYYLSPFRRIQRAAILLRAAGWVALEVYAAAVERAKLRWAECVERARYEV